MQQQDRKKEREQTDLKLRQRVDEIREHLKKNKDTLKEVNIKELRDQFLQGEEKEKLKNKLSEYLKDDDFISFKMVKKDCFFSYNEQEKQKKAEQTQVFRDLILKLLTEKDSPRLDHIETAHTKGAKDKWYLRKALRLMKKNKQIVTQRDGKTHIIKQYLAKEENEMKSKVAKLLDDSVQRVSEIKKQFAQEFPNSSTKTLSRILKLIQEEDKNVLRGRIGSTDYIYPTSRQIEFDNLSEKFDQDKAKFLQAMKDSNDNLPVTDLGEGFNYQEIMKFLNQEECGKVYYLGSDDKKTKIIKYKSDNINNQTKAIEEFFRQVLEVKSVSKCTELLYQHLQKDKKITQWIKITKDLAFPEKKEKKDKAEKSDKGEKVKK